MKSRAILTIIISLITGFIIGFIISSQITNQRTKDVSSLSSMKRFKERTYAIITPSEEQIKVIDPIVEKYAMKSDSIRKHAYQDFRIMIDDFHKELKPYLDKDQMQKLYDFPKHIHKSDDKKSDEKDDRGPDGDRRPDDGRYDRERSDSVRK